LKSHSYQEKKSKLSSTYVLNTKVKRYCSGAQSHASPSSVGLVEGVMDGPADGENEGCMLLEGMEEG
jgi:hypothetical protein